MAPSDALSIAIKAVQIYAEAHPRPSHVTQVQAAEMLDMSEATISRMVRTGQLRLNGSGRIPISEIDRLLELQ